MYTHTPPLLDLALLLRYLTGDSTPDEVRQVEAWRDQHPFNAMRLDALQQGAGGTISHLPVDVERGLVRLRGRLDNSDLSVEQKPLASIDAPRRSTWTRAFGRHLAAGITILTVGLIAYGIGSQSQKQVSIRAAAKTYQTAPGQRATITLPDGTHVTLSASSHLSYPADFGAQTREVTVEGEAYFEVIPRAANPFIVRAGESRTRVLGTSFAVRRYPGDSVVRVVVASGRVAVDSTVVNAGAVAFRSDRGVYVTHDLSSSRLLGWLTGELVFDKVPLHDALDELSHWYGVTFQYDPDIGNDTLVSSFTDRTIDDVIQAITESRGLTFTRIGTTILIRKHR